jgi:hypothetical protein
MARYLALLVLAVALAACSEQPLVAPKPTTFQSKARTVTDWSRLSVQTAEDIMKYLPVVPDSSAGTHMIDGKPVGSNLAARQLFLHPADPTVPFSRTFHDLLSLELMRRGEIVTKNPAGATIVNYDITVFSYNHPPADAHLPGSTTLLAGAAIGADAAFAAAPWAGLLVASAAVDVTREVVLLLGDQPNAEVALDIEVMAGDRSVYRGVQFFYIEDGDIPLYVGVLNTPKPDPLQTGPIAAAPTPARVMRVTAQ